MPYPPFFDPAWLRQQRDAHQVFTRARVIELLAEYEALQAHYEELKAEIERAYTATHSNKEYLGWMNHYLTPILSAGLLSFILLSGFLAYRLTADRAAQPNCQCATPERSAIESRILTDHSLEYDTQERATGTAVVRPRNLQRPLETMLKQH